MKILSDILYRTPLVETSGSMNAEISAIQFDSRKVEKGDLFVAVKGTVVDGHEFINLAIEKGAVAIVCHVMPEKMVEGITYVQVIDSHKALGLIAANYYDNPSDKLTIVGVTGTNGKTSCVTLLYKLFLGLGYSTGMLSTVVNKINEEEIESTHTTPDPINLNRLLSKMVKKGCTHCFMEVSSHAIHQNRIAGLRFNGAVFTNITHDHLDYHKTFDEYIKAKKQLFDNLPKNAFALVNADDKRGMVMTQNTKAKVNTFGIKTLCDFKAKIIDNTLQGLELDIDNHNVWFSLIGEFNAYNLLAVYGVACLLEEEPDEVLTVLSTLKSAPGRFDQVISVGGVIGIVDYAHTPDALLNVLKTIHDLKPGNAKIITVVGCGGNRDKEKRPVMGKIAAEWSDKVILTSDNPRNEEPGTIISEMEAGVAIVHRKKTIALPDRKEAIKLAGTLVEKGDIILLAGKGHEDYQEIKGVKLHFDDKEQLAEMFKLLDL